MATGHHAAILLYGECIVSGAVALSLWNQAAMTRAGGPISARPYRSVRGEPSGFFASHAGYVGVGVGSCRRIGRDSDAQYRGGRSEWWLRLSEGHQPQRTTLGGVLANRRITCLDGWVIIMTAPARTPASSNSTTNTT